MSSQKQPGMAVIFILSAVPLIMVLGNSMLIPVLPTIRSELHLSPFQVSLLITLFSVPAGIIIPLAGILSDRFGRKKIITPALLLYGAGGLLTGFASTWSSYGWMLAGRIIQGLGAAGTAPIAMALVSDLYQSRQRSKALGIIEAANGLGKVVSPILGSLIALITWYALFFTYPVLCVPIALGVWFLIHEKQKQQAPLPMQQYVDHLKTTFQEQGASLSVAFLAGAVTLFILFGVLFYLSDFLEAKYQIDGVPKGLVLAIPLLAMSSTSFWTGSHLQRKAKGMKAFTVTGLLIVAGGMSLVAFLSNTYLLITTLIAIGLGSGLVLPCLNTMITSAVGKQERGIVTSLYGSVRFLGVALGPPLFGIFEKNKLWLYLGNAMLAAITGLLALGFLRVPKSLKKPKQK